MSWFGDHLWATWLVAAFVLAVAELASLDLVLLMVAVAALGGMVAAIITGTLIIQIAVFAVVALALLGLVRPSLVRRLHHGPDRRFGVTRLIGVESVTTDRLTALEPGRIRIDGENWSAKPYDPETVIEPGTPVVVLEIRGATAYVHPSARRTDVVEL
jgi:membrane protein implicated in regulation of membrane protease activity